MLPNVNFFFPKHLIKKANNRYFKKSALKST